jgi:microcystin-dependent protein
MSDPYVGEIRLVGFTFAPIGWAFCDGSTMAISQNGVLYQLIGTTYGGDGQSTFRLPDLRGRVPIHMDPNNIIGSLSGAESVTLTAQQIPMHTHQAQCSGASSNTTNPAGNYWGSWADAQYSDQAPSATMNGGALGPVGGSQPHDNMVPFVALTFIIALEGLFPAQN